MFNLDDFVATMNDVVLTAEENDIGMFELVEIAANYIDEKINKGELIQKVYQPGEHPYGRCTYCEENFKESLSSAINKGTSINDIIKMATNYIEDELYDGTLIIKGEDNMKKVYKLKEKDQFINEAEKIIFEALDNEKEVPIVISVGDVVIELPMCADEWNEIDSALKECYEVEYGDLPQTTGNTKITSQSLLHRFFEREWRDIKKDKNSIFQMLRRFVHIGVDDCAMSDVAEIIRIEGDYRPSEISCLYEDFDNDKLTDIIVEEFNQFCMSKFEYVTSKDNKYDFLLFFGRDLDNGEVVGFDIHRDNQDWLDTEFDVINKYWDELNK